MRLTAIAIVGLTALGCHPDARLSESEGTASALATDEQSRLDPELEPGEHSNALPNVDLGPVMDEPNDVGQPFTLARIPGRVYGFYDGAGDVDALVLSADDLASLGVATVEVTPVAGMRPVVRLLNGDVDPPEVLAVWGAERPGEGAGVPNLGPIEGVSRLILAVSEAEGRSSPTAYAVLVHRPEPRAGDWIEREPNEDPELAGLIAGSGTMAGYFHTSQDRDLFRLVLSRDASVTTTLRPDARTDASLRWRLGDQEGEIVQDLSGVGEAEQLCSRFAPAGSILVEAAARAIEPATLSIYELTVRVEPEPFEREPNDQPSDAELQIVQGEVRGFIGTSTDIDVFGFRAFPTVDGSADQLVEVTPEAGLDVAIEVLDDVGASAAPRQDRGGRGQVERLSVPRAHVTYRLLVSAGRQGGEGCEASYEVRISAE